MTRIQPELDSLTPGRPLDRRTFVATTLGAGFALAVQPVLAQQAITTPADGLTAGEIRVTTKDGAIPAYRAQPGKGNGLATVLVVSEIFGVHEHIADVCRRLARLGYQAIAPELFVRQGDPRKLSSIPEIVSTIVSKVPDAQVMSDLDACAAWARNNGGDPQRLGITGFCWGGRITWLYAAHSDKLKAGVAWYGRLVEAPSALQPKYPIDLVGSLKAPVLGLYGGRDQGIPLDHVEDMQRELEKAGSPSGIHVYPDAPHAFHADYRPSYRKAEAEDGWARMLAWFAQKGVKA